MQPLNDDFEFFLPFSPSLFTEETTSPLENLGEESVEIWEPPRKYQKVIAPHQCLKFWEPSSPVSDTTTEIDNESGVPIEEKNCNTLFLLDNQGNEEEEEEENQEKEAEKEAEEEEATNKDQKKRKMTRRRTRRNVAKKVSEEKKKERKPRKKREEPEQPEEKFFWKMLTRGGEELDQENETPVLSLRRGGARKRYCYLHPHHEGKNKPDSIKLDLSHEVAELGFKKMNKGALKVSFDSIFKCLFEQVPPHISCPLSLRVIYPNSSQNISFILKWDEEKYTQKQEMI